VLRREKSEPLGSTDVVVGFVIADAGRPVAASRRATGRLRFIRLFMDFNS
jgi:hypothetical protein